MFDYVRDKWNAARLRARYQRLAQERVIHLMEATGPQAVAEDPGQWMLLGDSKDEISGTSRSELRHQARKLVKQNPHARNVLRLLEGYVVGASLNFKHISQEKTGENVVPKIADTLWAEFLRHNRTHFSFREFSRRTWRDGECFLRKFSLLKWPVEVRFIDPENIDATLDEPDTQGIITSTHDVETPMQYLRLDSATGELAERIPAEEILHTKIGVDSNQKRGVTFFSTILESLNQFESWLNTELTARRLQASIVLWRKVQGSPSQAATFADKNKWNRPENPLDPVRQEKFRAGTILTTSQGTDMQFLQPNTNFGDAVSLGRMLLLCSAAGAGLPEFMLTSDASNANFSSTMVAEGPAVKLLQSEQQFFKVEFEAIWRWVMSEAIAHKLLPPDFFERVSLDWKFPELIHRDRPKERTTDAKLVQAGVLSRAEVARRDKADPDLMRSEIFGESDEKNG